SERVRYSHAHARSWGFNSEKKRMTVIAPHAKTGGFRLYCKGAAEVVLKDCASQLLPDGSVVPLSDAERTRTAETIDQMADNGLRTLTLAFRDFATDEQWDESSPAPDDADLVLVGVVGIKDPVRPEVPGAVATCRRAGITVRM